MLALRSRLAFRLLLTLAPLLPAGIATGQAPAEAPTAPTAVANTDPRVAEAIRQLGDEAWEVRERAASVLIEIGEPCVRAVAEALRTSDNPEVKNRARGILLELEAWSTVPELLEERVTPLIESASQPTIWDHTSMEEPITLGEEFDGQESLLEHPDAAPFLIRALSHASPSVRSAACHWLGKSGTAGAVEPLRRIVENNDEDKEVRRCALWALGTIGNPVAAPSLLIALDSRDPDVQQAAAAVAEHLPAATLVPALIRLIESPSEEVRYHAFFSLTRLTGRRFGFNAFASEARRAPSVAAWKEWWTRNADGFRIPTPAPGK